MRMHEKRIVSFHVDLQGQQADAVFSLPADTFIYFVFAVDGIPIEESQSLAEIIAPLVIDLDLHEAGASTSVYRTRVDADVLGYPGNWHPGSASFVTLFPPFMLGVDWMYGIECECARDKDECPVHAGRLRTNVEYRLSLSIVEPIPLTNEVELWFYYPLREPEGS